MPQRIVDAIFDRRLYRASFFGYSGPFLIVGFVSQALIYIIVNISMLFLFVPLFVFIVLISGLLSKNLARREFHSIGHFRSSLFLVVSALAATIPWVFPQQANTASGLYQFYLTLTVSALALSVAIIEVTVVGHRISLRESASFGDRFFEKQKKLWKKELKSFPNSEKITNCLDDGQPIASLFERGSFNLMILWSCNVMEKILDAVAEGVTQKHPLKKSLFKNEKGDRLRYPTQLKNLNYVLRWETSREEEQINIDDLWDKVRNSIAHHNRRPTFSETYGAMIILVSFIQDFPRTLKSWES